MKQSVVLSLVLLSLVLLSLVPHHTLTVDSISDSLVKSQVPSLCSLQVCRQGRNYKKKFNQHFCKELCMPYLRRNDEIKFVTTLMPWTIRFGSIFSHRINFVCFLVVALSREIYKRKRKIQIKLQFSTTKYWCFNLDVHMVAFGIVHHELNTQTQKQIDKRSLSMTFLLVLVRFNTSFRLELNLTINFTLRMESSWVLSV